MTTTTKVNPFEPVEFNGFQLQNRLVMAPMTRSRAINFLPNGMMVDYYAQRASAGLIITEGVSPSPNGLGYARIPGIFNEEQVAGWKKVTAAVHEKGAKIFAQLMHTGRVAHPDNMPKGAKVLAPAAIPVQGQIWTDTKGMQAYPVPEAMTAGEILTAIQEFAEAAKNAVEAGFDGVELHGANGYLLEQFINPGVNTRADQHGGSVDNRLRFVLEVVDAAIAAIGKDRVGIRLSPFNLFNSMPAYQEAVDTYEILARKLNEREIRYIHVIESSARQSDEGKQLLSTMRTNFDGLVIVNGGYSRESIEAALDADNADLVALGVPFLANPDLVYRLENGLSLNAPHPETFYSADEKGYIDYPLYKN